MTLLPLPAPLQRRAPSAGAPVPCRRDSLRKRSLSGPFTLLIACKLKVARRSALPRVHAVDTGCLYQHCDKSNLPVSLSSDEIVPQLSAVTVMLSSLQCSVQTLPNRSFSSALSGRNKSCRICSQHSANYLKRPVRAVQPRSRSLARTHQGKPETINHSVQSHAQSTHQHTVQSKSLQEAHLSSGQQLGLQQWILRAVSSGAYSLSAVLVAGALEPAAAVGEFNPGSGASVTASQPPSIPNPIEGSGLTPFEGLLIFAPVILYGLFSVYRSQVNPRAKLSDFLFIAAAAVVVANLFTIIVFKKRLY